MDPVVIPPSPSFHLSQIMSGSTSFARESISSPPPEYVPWVEPMSIPAPNHSDTTPRSVYSTPQMMPASNATLDALLQASGCDMPPPVPPHDPAILRRNSPQERLDVVSSQQRGRRPQTSPGVPSNHGATRSQQRPRSSPRPAPDVLHHGQSRVLSRSSPLVPQTLVQSSAESVADIAPTEDPPVYAEAQLPTHPVTYTFSPIGANSMILVPPQNEPNSRPKYHISVSMDCFIPSMFITTIHRGGTIEGELVGDFQMGDADKSETVFIRGKEWRIREVFIHSGPTKTSNWNWGFRGRKLFWDCKDDVKLCYDSPSRTTLYAKFKPRTALRTRGRAPELATLEVLPDGQALFDDIVMTALISERWRLSTRSLKGS